MAEQNLVKEDDDLEIGIIHQDKFLEDTSSVSSFNITQQLQAASIPKEAGEEVNGVLKALPTPNSDFGISQEQLTSLTRDHDFSSLQQYEGVKGLSDMLKSSLEEGIHGDEADLSKRRDMFGSNTYPQKRGRSFWSFLWEASQDSTLRILMIAAVASLGLGMKTQGPKQGWYDGGSIVLAVFLVIVITAVSDYRQSLQFQNLNEQKRNIQLEVIRGGRRAVTSIYDLVVGDVIPLKIGDQVPADGITICSYSLAIDESSMTGESKIVHKDLMAPFLMSGCKVADGYGTMLVTSVGMNTEWGLTMASISEENTEDTPLQVRLLRIASTMGKVGVAVSVILLFVLLARYFTGHTRNPDGSVQYIARKTSFGDATNGVVKIFTAAVLVVVIAVPEGLPLAVTLILAYSMKKMMADKALVRRLSSCETMGCATTICSDKTGTLTLNQMSVVEAYISSTKIHPSDNTASVPSTVKSLLVEGIAQNTAGTVYMQEGDDIEISGSPTEKALLLWGVKIGMDFDAIKKNSSIIHVLPFNSEKKRGGVALNLPASQVHIHWKGAPEIILDLCTRYFDANGELAPIDEDKMRFLKTLIEDMAARSLRCVAMAYRSYAAENIPSSEQELQSWALPENELILLAIIGLKDPCRPGVKHAVELCTNAGVKVRMITGDNLQTARAIALECGILKFDEYATEPNLIEGSVFRALSEEQRLEIVEQISVMGRSSPNDKLLLVQALRKKGHIVAVTGDGTNDAPALHEADIGLSMGIQGTEIAKESSDIIILDDNFASIVKVVRWGRSVYANIQKFIQFQLTINFSAIAINVVAAVTSGDVPLNAVQLLWVNLIQDSLGALALATEPPTDNLMQRPPIGRREPIVTNIIWKNLLLEAIYQSSVVLVLNYHGNYILKLGNGDNKHVSKVRSTLIFNAYVFCQIFNEFNARKPNEINIFKGIGRNSLFMGVVGTTLVLQVIIIFFLQNFFLTVRLDWKLWLVSIGIGFMSWPVDFIGKLVSMPETPLREFFRRRRSNEIHVHSSVLR